MRGLSYLESQTFRRAEWPAVANVCGRVVSLALAELPGVSQATERRAERSAAMWLNSCSSGLPLSDGEDAIRHTAAEPSQFPTWESAAVGFGRDLTVQALKAAVAQTACRRVSLSGRIKMSCFMYLAGKGNQQNHQLFSREGTSGDQAAIIQIGQHLGLHACQEQEGEGRDNEVSCNFMGQFALHQNINTKGLQWDCWEAPPKMWRCMDITSNWSCGGEGSQSMQLPRQVWESGAAEAWGLMRAKTGCPGTSDSPPLAWCPSVRLLGSGTARISSSPSPYSTARTPSL